jgi:hypothetical protein
VIEEDVRLFVLITAARRFAGWICWQESPPCPPFSVALNWRTAMMQFSMIALEVAYEAAPAR